MRMTTMWMASTLVLAACNDAPHDITADAAPGGSTNNGDASGASDAPAASATCNDKQAQPRNATWTLEAGGVERTARVHVPPSYDPSKRTPLVLNIHGRSSTATQQAAVSHAHAKADAEGFVVIHPESLTTPTSWNGGTCCNPAVSNDVDDAGFIAALLDEAETRLCIDPDRVYAMGLSNGGYMSYRVACEMADRFAAIGPVAGLLLLPGCAPSRPVPVMHVHGTSDAIVGYAWVDETIDFWRAENACTTTSTTYENGAATCVTHGGCAGGADVVLCSIDGGGHQWPGGEAIPLLGAKSDDLIATDALWDFFVAHPRPSAK